MDLHHGGEYQSEMALVDPTQSPHEGDEAHLMLHESNAATTTTTTTTTTTPTESHLINHHHLIALQEEEVVYGHPQGSRGGRLYKKSNWVVEEMLVLQAAKREDAHRKGAAPASQQAQERWNWIEDFCWASGVQRSAQQCHDKWEVISTAYKKVYSNEKYVGGGGQKSYWNMSPDERKRNKLPPNFQKEIFTALLEWCNNKIRNSDSGELVVDTSGPLGPSGVKAELDSEEESGEETSGPNQSVGKKRKLWSKGDEAGGLASILVRNNKNVVEAMLESEDRKDKRHREDLEMERVKLELEKEKFRGAMRLGSGYIDALVNIGDGLKQLSAALCSNIHS